MYVFSKDSSVVDRMLSEISCGGVTVNDVLMHTSREFPVLRYVCCFILNSSNGSQDDQ